jgi:hypothetical protein
MRPFLAFIRLHLLRPFLAFIRPFLAFIRLHMFTLPAPYKASPYDEALPSLHKASPIEAMFTCSPYEALPSLHKASPIVRPVRTLWMPFLALYKVLKDL